MSSWVVQRPEEGVSEGRKAPSSIPWQTSPTLEGTRRWRPNCRPGALAALSCNPLKPGTGGQGEGNRDRGPGVQPQVVSPHSEARITGPAEATVQRARGGPAGVPVGRHGLGRPRPAWPVPGATRARPRGHPCYCPAPRTDDPSVAAAPRHLRPPAWLLPGGEGRPGSGGLSGGFAAPPPPRDPAGLAPRPLAPQPLRCPPGSGTCWRC